MSGGDSVANQLISPRSKGLFHRAILQSANCSHQFVHRKKPFLCYDSAEDAGKAEQLIKPVD